MAERRKALHERLLFVPVVRKRPLKERNPRRKKLKNEIRRALRSRKFCRGGPMELARYLCAGRHSSNLAQRGSDRGAKCDIRFVVSAPPRETMCLP